MRSVSKLFAMVVMLWVGVVVALMGCDRHYSPDDPISPRADIKITTLNLQQGSILSPAASDSAGGTGSVTASSTDFPQVNARLQVFNGIAVQLLDYRVDYFQQDGVTPLGIGSFGGLLTLLLPGGTLSENNATSIAPGSTPINVGVASSTDVLLKVVSDELRSFLAGPDGTFRTTTENTTDTDDFRGLVVAQLRIRGVDINSNRVEVITRLAVSATVATDPALAGASTGP